MSETQVEIVEEVTGVVADTPATQRIEAAPVEEVEQSDEDRAAAVAKSIDDACQQIKTLGHNGFVLITLNDQGNASALMAGDYATVVHAVHTGLCALGSIVKRVQGEAEGNPEKHASVEDFTAGASILSVHHNMVAKMQAEAIAEAANDSTTIQ
jgi:hypothetical protein